MTITARERAYALFKEGFDTATKIKKQLATEGHDISRSTIENWRRRDNWDSDGAKAAKAVLKAVTAIRQGAELGPVDAETKANIQDALNELAMAVFEGAQAVRALIPKMAEKIQTVSEFNSFVRTIAEIALLNVTARAEMSKIPPGPSPDGGDARPIDDEHSQMEKVYSDVILEFKNKHG